MFMSCIATAQQKIRLAARKVNILINRITPCIITIFGKQLTGIISNMRNVAKIVATYNSTAKHRSPSHIPREHGNNHRQDKAFLLKNQLFHYK